MTGNADKKSKEEIEKSSENNIDISEEVNGSEITEKQNETEEKIAVAGATNTHLRRLISSNYVEYASYVIKERAIPELRDGFKPVQRRILWSLFRMDDGKFHKVANIVGHSMQYHPHGDASIYHALVNLANKEFFIDRQGNFGNVLTGDEAAAARYIEARLTPLGREVLFNPDITEFTDSYDGRNKEPVFLPAKVPVVLMVGQEGIAPGMTTMILPHNFKELLEAQIAVLKNEPFKIYPDFIQGGRMDVSEYDDGSGKVTVRAKVDIEGRKLIIREIPPFTTTEKLIASIEKADSKNKLKIASINDYTAESVEIEIVPARGYNPEKALKALYTYTDCSISVSSSMLVIKDNRPVIMNVSDIVREYTAGLVEYLRRELQLELDRLNERYHERTLERIFIENRLYKRIEECETYKLVQKEVRKGLNPFLSSLKREINDKDIEKLLGIPIRRISKFDINKNKEETEKILVSIKEVENNLRQIKKYTVKYIEQLIKTYGDKHPRKTKIDELEEIDKKAAALNNIRVGWDKKNCYIGDSIRSDEVIRCNEYDHLICIEKSGKYKIISIPQKIYVGKLYYFNKYSGENVFSIIYKDKKTGVYYTKRTKITKFIRDKGYNLIPKNCQIEQLTIRDNSIYECKLEKTVRQKIGKIEVDFSQVQMRNPGARGFKLTGRKIKKIIFTGFAEIQEESLKEYSVPEIENSNKIEAEEKNEPEKTASEKQKDKGNTEKPEKKLNKEQKDKEGAKEKPVEKTSKSEESKVEKEKKEPEKDSGQKQEEDKEKTEKNEKKKSSKPVEEKEPEEAKKNKGKKPEKEIQQKSKKPEKKSQPSNKKEITSEQSEDKNSEDDDWGIIQPDLGF